jgi:hypothetical protein
MHTRAEPDTPADNGARGNVHPVVQVGIVLDHSTRIHDAAAAHMGMRLDHSAGHNLRSFIDAGKRGDHGRRMPDADEAPPLALELFLHSHARARRTVSQDATEAVDQPHPRGVVVRQSFVVTHYQQVTQAALAMAVRCGVGEAKHRGADGEQGVCDHQCVAARTHDDDGHRSRCHGWISSSTS